MVQAFLLTADLAVLQDQQLSNAAGQPAAYAAWQAMKNADARSIFSVADLKHALKDVFLDYGDMGDLLLEADR